MINIETLVVKITTDTKRLVSGIQNSNRHLGKLKTVADKTAAAITRMKPKLDAVAASMKRFGRTISLFVTAPLVYAGTKMFQAAVDAQETSSKFDTVFSSIGGRAKAAAAELNKSWGMSSIGAKRALGDTGDLLTGLGYTQQAALDLSMQTQKLAVDLASFTNVEGGAKRASEAITRALLGEREMMKALGVAILEKDVKAKVAQMTTEGMTFANEKAAKAAATLALIVQQSPSALGDYARTADSVANRTKRMWNAWEDAKVALGQALLPLGTKIVGMLSSIANWINNLTEKQKKWIVYLGLAAASVGPLLIVTGTLVSSVTTLAAAYTSAAAAMTAWGLAAKGAAVASALASWPVLLTAIAAAAGFAAYKLGTMISEMTAGVKKARALQAQAEKATQWAEGQLALRKAEKAAAAATQGGGSMGGMYGSISDGAKQAKDSIDNFILSVQRQYDVMRYGERTVKLNEMEAMGMSKTDLAEVKRMYREMDKLKRAEAMKKVLPSVGSALQKSFGSVGSTLLNSLKTTSQGVMSQIQLPDLAAADMSQPVNRRQATGVGSLEHMNRMSDYRAGLPSGPTAKSEKEQMKETNLKLDKSNVYLEKLVEKFSNFITPEPSNLS